MNFPLFETEVCKVLSKISKEKACEGLAEWIKPCVKHLHWSATSTFSGDGMVIWAKFKSFLSHVVNKHTDLEDPLFNKCSHGEIQPRKWLRIGRFRTLFICRYDQHAETYNGQDQNNFQLCMYVFLHKVN